MEIFDRLESEVRTYSRSFPAVFERAEGAHVIDEQGNRYIDFFCGAGALNYGHNPPAMRRLLIEYIERGGIAHSLDMATAAKRSFLARFESTILHPRGLSYRVQFCGPTGANAVEAMLKLVRKATGRKDVIFFTNAFHGVTIGALSINGDPWRRATAGISLPHTIMMPFDGFFGPGQDTVEYLESFLRGRGALDVPAAIVLETIQAEGGVNVARVEWLERLFDLARRYRILFVVDDIQMGCGRTGPFFSFERAAIQPDIVCLSKSISGFGLPMSLLLIQPELDVWVPGEHNGTFRGQNLAFVTAAEALSYWETGDLSDSVRRKGALAAQRLEALAARHPEARGSVRGLGLIQGLDLGVEGLAKKVCREAFRRGLLVECTGPEDNVIKVLPPLTIAEPELLAGLAILESSLAAVLPARDLQEQLDQPLVTGGLAAREPGVSARKGETLV
ncbi:MAG TPA: diaminobutyrate--2-oxoglutarate transaminase [Thermoanaerobaculia bacterium]|nr:diaminobutyrate--2-oxoglutarate transaminase [Thermoanaerobaculia bacterium]